MSGQSLFDKTVAKYTDAGSTPTVADRDDLHQWWLDHAESEVGPLVAKAAEYGGLGRALDLLEIGRAMVKAGCGWTGASEAELSELGIYFYVQGKMARWTAAVSEGRLVSDDTLYDIGIYVRMVQRIREVGGWPK